MAIDISIYILLILGIAVVDSINPSALVVSGYLLHKAPEEKKTTSVLAYVSGIFTFYLAVGIALLLGASLAVDALRPIFESHAAYLLQAVLGVALFAWSWIPPKPIEQSRLHPKKFNLPTLLMLGITITLIEFTTALPYLGAIALLQNAPLEILPKIAVLGTYNVIFVLPPLVLLAVYVVNRQRFLDWQTRRMAKKDKPSDIMQWIAGVVGVLLFLNALEKLGVSSINIG